MTQPILAIEEDKSKPSPKAVANLLPCRVHHDGLVDPLDGYWTPTKSEDGVNIAYFRGRKLKGKTVTLPEEYRGVLVERKADEQQKPPIPEDGEGQPVDIGGLQVTAGFDEMVVWGHESVASAEADPYIRSVEEWLQVAEQVCTDKRSDELGEKKG
ncbi:hypothetical protein ACRE_071900 [Hapsidospora chrysogenum ATCC 11550]|uniref:Uncharacterized protein n=1 Tax=Hapsidospora chrysogenum (strain ATCC 11550 / CBS 779.69 / DSM 880 / IAM 14645 / JCM 23072 / IMI 49137) TaxID=857340 RepID=A0A086SY95_HAPC1|nr:hypothetical protein ACRE_071900 [Hapsidospora chrysogenum ATCC 11550]